MFKKLLLLALSACLYSSNNFAQQPNPNYHLKATDFVAAKNYYLLTLMQNTPAVKRLLESDPELLKLTAAKLAALKASLDCKEVLCFTQQLKFSADEIKQVGERLAKLYRPNNALGALVKTDLIPSGSYILLSKGATPQQLLIKAWEQDAEGLNYAISVYADGSKKTRYPDIDSISFNVKSKSYPNYLHDESWVVLNEYKNSKLFFAPVLNYALQAMEINGRRDAANFEPLADGVNKAALLKIKQTNWAKYKYSLILVLGEGPEDPAISISSGSMLRARMGAINYFAGLAPFIMVSGGMAHPYKTRYCEALEMKKYLVNTLHVPANAIIAETQARHTTTNVRNGVRLIYHYHIPFTKAFLTTTTPWHSLYVEKSMAARCLKELKLVPYTIGKRVSETTLELYPALEALQINPLEPLDP